jgi:hypothetical protein
MKSVPFDAELDVEEGYMVFFYLSVSIISVQNTTFVKRMKFCNEQHIWFLKADLIF